MFNKKNPMRYFSGSTFARLPLYKLAIFGGAGCMVVALVLMIPQLLLSVLMYWLCIFLRSRRQDSVSRDCGA